MKAEYDFSVAIQGAIITAPADRTKICFYLDNASLRCLQEQGDLAEIGYEALLNRALKKSLPQLFPPEKTIQVKDLKRFTFRLKNLITKGKTCRDHLLKNSQIKEGMEAEFEEKKRLNFHLTMAWLASVNTLMEIFFQNQNVVYVRSLKELTGKMTIGTSVNRMAQILYILEELAFDIDNHIFNLDELHD